MGLEGCACARLTSLTRTFASVRRVRLCHLTSCAWFRMGRSKKESRGRDISQAQGLALPRADCDCSSSSDIRKQTFFPWASEPRKVNPISIFASPTVR